MRLSVIVFCVALSAGAARADENCTVILDVTTGAPIVREGICDRRLPPQSSFKLPLALMGFDSGVLTDEHTPRLEWRPELGAGRDVEKTTHDPASWLAVSVVWFSQELTASSVRKSSGPTSRRSIMATWMCQAIPARTTA